MTRIVIAVLSIGVGIDLVGHSLDRPDFAEIGHLVVLFAMVAIIVTIVVRSNVQPPTSQGDPHAIR